MSNSVSPLSRDWAVLCHLDLSGRATYAELGRRIGLSKETVKNIVSRLEQRGIVSHYMAFIDVTRLGFTPYVVYAQFRNAIQSEREKIVAYLCSRPEVYWVARMGGHFDLLFGITALNVRTFAEHLEHIQKASHGKLSNLSTHTRLRTVQFPRSYLSERAPSRKPIQARAALALGHDTYAVKIPELDRHILNSLSQNARVSVSELSSRLGASRITVQKHIAALESTGVIQGYGANVHAETLGYEIYRLLIGLSDRSSPLVQRIFNYAKGNPHVVFFDHGIGAWDIELTCEVRNQKGVQKILSELRDNFGEVMSSVELLLVYEDNTKFQFTV